MKIRFRSSKGRQWTKVVTQLLASFEKVWQAKLPKLTDRCYAKDVTDKNEIRRALATTKANLQAKLIASYRAGNYTVESGIDDEGQKIEIITVSFARSKK